MRIPSMIPTRDDATSSVLTAPSIKPLRIGPLVVDPPLLQAPMAGFTNYAYRQVVREFGGVGLQATEMVSARGLRLDESERRARSPRPPLGRRRRTAPAGRANVG